MKREQHNGQMFSKRLPIAWLILTALIILILGSVAAGYKIAPPKAVIVEGSEPVKVAATSKKSFGVSLGDVSYMSTADRLLMLQRIKTAGFDEVRYNLDWSAVEAKKGVYDWAKSDQNIKAAKDAGLQSIVTLDRTPVWARMPECKADFFCPPTDSGAFAKFSATAADRYRASNVVAWEIWNEPNIVWFWKPLPNANQYAALLKKSYKAIKDKNPNAVVLIGGLAGDSNDEIGVQFMDPRTFLGQIYASPANKSFDGVAYHPYTKLRLPNVNSIYNGWYKMVDSKPSIRSIMVANGDSEKKLWLTEFGNPSGGAGEEQIDLSQTNTGPKVDHVSQDNQAKIAEVAIGAFKTYDWAASLDWFNYKDNASASKDKNGAYGLYASDGSAKPVLHVFQSGMKEIR